MQSQNAPLTLSGGLSWKAKFAMGVLVLIVIAFLAIAAAVAKTGFVRVPIISSVVKSVGAPSRIVTIPVGTPTVQDTFKTQFEGAVARYARSRQEQDREVQIRISEASIAQTLLTEMSRINQSEGANIQSVQIAMEPGFGEVFVVFDRGGGVQNTILAEIQANIRDQRPVIKVQRLVVGTMLLPAALLNLMNEAFTETGLKETIDAVQSVLEIKEIEFRKGFLIVHGTLASGVVNGR